LLSKVGTAARGRFDVPAKTCQVRCAAQLPPGGTGSPGTLQRKWACHGKGPQMCFLRVVIADCKLPLTKTEKR
jgi:hypothetical protein